MLIQLYSFKNLDSCDFYFLKFLFIFSSGQVGKSKEIKF